MRCAGAAADEEWTDAEEAVSGLSVNVIMFPDVDTDVDVEYG